MPVIKPLPSLEHIILLQLQGNPGIGKFLNVQKSHLPNNGRRLSKESLASLPDDIIFVLKLITLRHAKYN